MFYTDNYYIYHLYIKETGEIFYVGEGQEDERFLDNSTYLEIKNIQERYVTDVRIVAENLTIDEARKIKFSEINRIITETDNVLVNRIIPYKIRESSFYERDLSLEYKKEVAPVLYASEIDKRYYGIEHKVFDAIEEKYLSKVVIENVNISKDELRIVYNRKFDEYYKEVVELLEMNTSKILKSRYSKSMTACIYVGDEYIRRFNEERKRRIEKIGREVPVYHLIDVWKYLKNKFENINIDDVTVEIKPINGRIPFHKIRHRKTVRGKGHVFWREGEEDRKAGYIIPAISNFDEAREHGYHYPELYKSYAKVYRKIGDLDNEIDILNEAIEVFSKEKIYAREVMEFYSQKIKAIKKLKKKEEKISKILKKLQNQ